MRRRYTFSRAARVWRTTGDRSGGGGGGGSSGGGVRLCLPPRRHLDAPPPYPPAPPGGAGAGRRRRRSARSASHVTSSLPHRAPRRPPPPRLLLGEGRWSAPPILTAPCLRRQARAPRAPADPVPVVGSKGIPEPKRSITAAPGWARGEGPGFREGGGGSRRPLRRVTCLLLPPALERPRENSVSPPPLFRWLPGRRSELLVPGAGQRAGRAHASHTCLQRRAGRGPKLFSEPFWRVASAQEVTLWLLWYFGKLFITY